jgi:hypothetical protein
VNSIAVQRNEKVFGTRLFQYPRGPSVSSAGMLNDIVSFIMFENIQISFANVYMTKATGMLRSHRWLVMGAQDESNCPGAAQEIHEGMASVGPP